MSNELKSLVVAEEIKADPALLWGVEKATDVLIGELGPSSGTVDVIWRYNGDGEERGDVELQIADFTGLSVERFTPKELEAGDHLQRRLYKLWGRLLREGLRRQLDRLHQVVQELEG